MPKQLYDKNRNYTTDSRYKEIHRLHEMLENEEIPHTFEKFLDGWQVCYPDLENRIADAVEHFGSYGNEEDKLEIMGLLTPEEQKHDDVLGYLTAKEVFERMKLHYVRNERNQ